MKATELEAIRSSEEQRPLRERLISLEGEKLYYKDIAGKLRAEGHQRPGGGEWSESDVSQTLTHLGVRRVVREPKPGPVVFTPEPPVSKWDVLRMIEKCGDFTTPTRLAIMQLILGETVK